MKKILFSIIAFLLFLSCGSKANNGKNEDGIVRLKWYMAISPVAPDTQKVIDELNKYTREKIGVEIDYTVMPVSDYKEKMPTLINSGQEFDIAFTAHWTTNYLQFAEKDAWYDITDLLPKYAKETYDFIPDSMWDAVRVKGRIYGVPSYNSGTQRGILYNKSIADKYGIDMSNVKTLEDFGKVLEQVHNKSKAEGKEIIGIAGLRFEHLYPFEGMLTNPILPAAFAVPEYGLFKEFEGRVFNQYESKDYENFINLAHNWYKNGYTPADPVEYAKDFAGRDNDFAKGKLFAYVIGYAPGYKEAQAKALGFDVDYLGFGAPLFEKFNAMGGIMAISSGSKHPEKALEFINLLNTDKYVGTLIRHGIEGVHYTAVGDNKVDQTLGGKITADKNGYAYSLGWQFGSVFNQKWDISYPQNIEELFKENAENAIAAKNVGVILDTESIQNQIAAVTNVIEKYKYGLETGHQDPKELAQFNKELKENGLDDIIKEVQRQVDEFNKNNK